MMMSKGMNSITPIRTMFLCFIIFSSSVIILAAATESLIGTLPTERHSADRNSINIMRHDVRNSNNESSLHIRDHTGHTVVAAIHDTPNDMKFNDRDMNHGKHDMEMDHTKHDVDMDHTKHHMDHSKHGIDHSKHDMDHSKHDMIHSKHGMDHSKHDMDHTKHDMDMDPAKQDMDMDHTTTMGDMNMDHGMMMYFRAGVDVTILFKEWKVTTVGGMIGSVIGIFLLAMIYEGLKYFREYLFKQYVSSIQFSTVAVTGESGRVTQVHKIERHHMLSWPHALQTILHITQIIISYFLMLIFMTYNVWLCMAVVFGAGAGYFIFGWKKASVVDITEHCH